MRVLSVLLAAAVALTPVVAQPARADDKSDAVVAGAILGALIAGAAAKNAQKSQRFDYAHDTIFFPPGRQGWMCYVNARQCYVKGHYSASATREIFH